MRNTLLLQLRIGMEEGGTASSPGTTLDTFSKILLAAFLSLSHATLHWYRPREVIFVLNIVKDYFLTVC